MNLRSINVRTIQDALSMKGHCQLYLRIYVSIYFRIRAQVAYILIMPFAKWTTEWFITFLV